VTRTGAVLTRVAAASTMSVCAEFFALANDFALTKRERPGLARRLQVRIVAGK